MEKKDEFTEALEANKPNNIYYKLSLVKQEIGVLSKNAKNPFFKSDYLDLNGILSAVEPLLFKHGLVLLQPINMNEVMTLITDTETEQSVQSQVIIPCNITDPQKLGSAITYFRRYTLQSLLALQAVDDDGNHASKPEPKILNKERFNDALTAIKGGKITAEYLKNEWDLSVEQLSELENL
jgi:hypothetical protein